MPFGIGELRLGVLMQILVTAMVLVISNRQCRHRFARVRSAP